MFYLDFDNFEFSTPALLLDIKFILFLHFDSFEFNTSILLDTLFIALLAFISSKFYYFCIKTFNYIKALDFKFALIIFLIFIIIII